jgi:hypothetical protein
MTHRSDRTEAEKAREDSLYRILAGAFGAMVEDLIWGGSSGDGSGCSSSGSSPKDCPSSTPNSTDASDTPKATSGTPAS